MRLEEHYLTLRENFRDYAEMEAFHTTISDIAELLDCTERHAKYIVKKLSEEAWITWETFRGRGKRPRLTFHYSKVEIEKQFVKELIADGKYTEVIEKLNHFDIHIQEETEHFFEKYFGYTVEQGSDSEQELDILRYPLRQKVDQLDPLRINSRQSYQLIEHIYDTLVIFEPKENTIKPHLCYYWESNGDATAWFFYIRKRVFFHNGKQLDAKDVCYSLERLRSDFRTIGIAEIKQIEEIHRYVVKVTLEQPSYLFPHILCDKMTSIVPKDSQFEKGELPVGSGPFRVTDFTEDKVVLAAHEHYFHVGPHLDRVELVYVHEGLQETSLKFSYAEMRKERRTWKPLQQVISGAAYISFNGKKAGIHQHPAFRRAFELLITLFKETVCDEERPPAYGFVYSENEMHKEAWKEEACLHEIARLLKEARYQGEVLHLFLPFIEGGTKQLPYAKKIATFCKKVGIFLEVHAVPLQELGMEENQKQADMLLLSFILQEDVIQSLYVALYTPTYFISNMLTEERREQLYQQLALVRMNPNPTDQLEQLIEIESELKENREVLFLHHLRMKLYHHESDNMAGIDLSVVSGDVHYNLVWYKKHEVE